MDNEIEIDLILSRNNYSKIYSASLIIGIILLVVGYILFTYKYQSYYIGNAIVLDNKLRLLVNINDIGYIDKNNMLSIDGEQYLYKIMNISEELYVDDNYNNYKYVYLKVNNISNIDNYVYEVKIAKENKVLANYLKEFI